MNRRASRRFLFKPLPGPGDPVYQVFLRADGQLLGTVTSLTRFHPSGAPYTGTSAREWRAFGLDGTQVGVGLSTMNDAAHLLFGVDNVLRNS